MIQGAGWRLQHDEASGESWLVVEDVRGLRVGERQVEVLLPDELDLEAEIAKLRAKLEPLERELRALPEEPKAPVKQVKTCDESP